jgi:transposase-like protein
VTRLGTLRIKVARTRKRGFLPEAIQAFERRTADVALLIREAFLQGIATRQVGRVVARVRREVLSAQSVSRLCRSLDEAVKKFHEQALKDEWAYLFLDGVSLRMRRPAGRKRIQMLVAYGIRRDGSRHLLAFVRSTGESQAAWEGLLQDLFRRGLEGKNLLLVVTDGCAGLAAALQTVYPRVPHQRCWVHKMRNILERVRKRDYEQVKAEAQAIYRAENVRQAQQAFRCFQAHWRGAYPSTVKQLEKDLPELLTFYRFPRQLWRKLRTTNVIERCFVEVRRRTRPMVCFVNAASMERIIYAIFSKFNGQWRDRTLRIFTQAA